MYRIAVDIGGTFTDIVLEDKESILSEKVLTTTTNPEIGAITGIQNIIKKKGISFNHNVAKEVIEALLEEMETDNWNNFETN